MHAHLQKLFIFALITFFAVTWTSFLHQGGLSFFDQDKAEGIDISTNPILNSTLGVCSSPHLPRFLADRHNQFQEIFALALPGRADRVVPLLDAANASNISITILDAVRDKQIPIDAWPKTWKQEEDHKSGELGCLVSHVRTWEK